MAVGSEQRRDDRRQRLNGVFTDVEAALDLLYLGDLAWHDCYGPHDLEIPPDVLDDVLLLADGDLATLIRTVRAAVIDFRDIRMAADTVREASLGQRH